MEGLRKQASNGESAGEREEQGKKGKGEEKDGDIHVDGRSYGEREERREV